MHKVGEIAEVMNAEDRLADDILAMNRCSVRGIIGVALGAEAQNAAVLSVGQNLNDPMGGHRILIQHEGDGVADLQFLGSTLLTYSREPVG